jgi:DNA-binding HxlR family transcriptional regulator
VLILQSLSEGPKRQVELRRDAGSPAQTTLRAQLKRLASIGVIEKHRRNRFPGVLEYELTPAGRDLLAVAGVLDRWLAKGAEGSLTLGSNEAKAAVKALAEGWSTTMLRALAAGPLSLTELDSVIGSVSYPSLERRLGAMKLTGQIEARPSNGRGVPYAVTNWLRRGAAPLMAAMCWEQRHRQREAPSLKRIDVEAVFLLTVPLLRGPKGISGSCQLTVEIPHDAKRQPVTIAVDLVDGNVTACTTRPQAGAEASAAGHAMAWFSSMLDAAPEELELSGKTPLGSAVLSGLHDALFPEQLDVSGPIR